MKDFLIYITMDCWKLERGGLFQDTEEEEESVITYPHLCILPITSADNPRSNSPQFTHLNIRISAAPHIHILPEALAHRWVVSLKPDCTARLCASILCSSFSGTAFFAPKYRPSWTHRSKIEFGNICSGNRMNRSRTTMRKRSRKTHSWNVSETQQRFHRWSRKLSIWPGSVLCN